MSLSFIMNISKRNLNICAYFYCLHGCTQTDLFIDILQTFKELVETLEETDVLGCGSFVRSRKRKKGDSIPFILSRRDYMLSARKGLPHIR